jgi:hypothetical protein
MAVRGVVEISQVVHPVQTPPQRHRRQQIIVLRIMNISLISQDPGSAVSRGVQRPPTHRRLYNRPLREARTFAGIGGLGQESFKVGKRQKAR